MACVRAAENKKALICDMPRSIPKAKLEEVYAGIETIKNGICYDRKYACMESRSNRPQVALLLAVYIYIYMHPLQITVIFLNF